MSSVTTETEFHEPKSMALPDLKTLRAAIPSHCFQPSLFRSLSYVIRDLVLVAILFFAAVQLSFMDPSPLRSLLWGAYGFAQGLVFVGLWILAHECGHDSFSLHHKANATIGFLLHSILLVPFFSWKFSHSRHHRYANHMEKDTVFVPARKSDYRSSFWTGSFLGHAEDAPIVSILLLIAHQLFGWPLYLIFNAGAGVKSLVNMDRGSSFRQSHLDPRADVFSSREHPFVLLSNLGVLFTVGLLWTASRSLGVYNIFLIYGIPYLWMNHWIVAITFLHHTHPDAPHYDKDAWTFQKGALSTVDRDFGFIGEHLFHGIIEYHVVHHMFPRIPFYHAKEATESIKPLLGKSYIQQKTSFLSNLWSTFSTCSFVEEKSVPGTLVWASKAGG